MNISQVLTHDAIQFLEELSDQFSFELEELLAERIINQSLYDKGELPDFCNETSYVRTTKWKVAEIPLDLLDRRVEITGPAERKIIINGLNSCANVFMADFEDSLSPTWENIIEGHSCLIDAVNGTLSYFHPTKKIRYKINENRSTLFVRPRGLHLKEKNFIINGDPIPAALFDFGLFMFHNASNLLSRGTGPYFYIPKLESYKEARWWNHVFTWSQSRLSIPLGSIRATVLIETLPAVFQMNEILYELKEHSAGLNCGRWDYIFSFIKTVRNHSERVFPDRSKIDMSVDFMKAYSKLLVHTCHKRGIHAMGGMAAQIPIKSDQEANIKALNKVHVDKLREVHAGHDGTWVAHPDLISVAKKVFDEYMPEKNQIVSPKVPCKISREDLLRHPDGKITEAGLRKNINVSIRYLESWLRGKGCVPLYYLMEDAATAEISRTQVWQWLNHSKFNEEYFIKIMNDELNEIRKFVGSVSFSNGKYHEAAEIFKDLSISESLESFLTLPAYERLD